MGAMNAAEQGERAANRQVERAVAALEARLKETYDRMRAAIDQRISSFKSFTRALYELFGAS